MTRPKVILHFQKNDLRLARIFGRSKNSEHLSIQGLVVCSISTSIKFCYFLDIFQERIIGNSWISKREILSTHPKQKIPNHPKQFKWWRSQSTFIKLWPFISEFKNKNYTNGKHAIQLFTLAFEPWTVIRMNLWQNHTIPSISTLTEMPTKYNIPTCVPDISNHIQHCSQSVWINTYFLLFLTPFAAFSGDFPPKHIIMPLHNACVNFRMRVPPRSILRSLFNWKHNICMCRNVGETQSWKANKILWAKNNSGKEWAIMVPEMCQKRKKIPCMLKEFGSAAHH